jgi:hypothetical protein
VRGRRGGGLFCVLAALPALRACLCLLFPLLCFPPTPKQAKHAHTLLPPVALALLPARCRQPLVPREAVTRVSRGVEAKSRAVGLASGNGSSPPRSKL